MLRMSAKSVFDDKTAANELLITTAASNIPKEFAKRFRKNVVSITPMDTGALRRSLVVRAQGYTAQIGWRLPYALDQNAGRDLATGKVYKNYTTPGTGPRFKDIALERTMMELDPMFREMGLKK